MTATTVARHVAHSAVQVEYLLVRTPLVLLDRGVGSRLRSDSPVRRTLGRSLHTLDALAEQLLAATSPAGRDADVSDEGDDLLDTGRVRPAAPGEPLPEQEQEEIEVVAEELLEEEEFAPRAGELADADEDEQRRMAELRAKHLVEEQAEAEELERQRAELAAKADARKPR